MWCLARPSTYAPSLIRRVHPKRWYSSGASDPLRILFCGSDAFSCASLEALHQEHVRNPGLIQSIDVVVRPGKPTGRGLKVTKEVPLKSLAQRLELPIHERNTFTGWRAKNSINLIVAVSFGLFVPARMLRAARYGGLNVHPSLLPDLRGPAPLHHTLLLDRSHTGVTLQTLDDKAFDHGTVLAQTPLPGIPVPENSTLESLHGLVTPSAATMLVEGLRDGVHVPPLEDVGWTPSENEMETIKHAPKVTKQHQQINWAGWTAADLLRHRRVLGPLWCFALSKEGDLKRLIIEEAESVPYPERVVEYLERLNSQRPGDNIEDYDDVKSIIWFWKPESTGGQNGMRHVKVPYFLDEDGKSVIIPAVKGGCLRIPAIKMEGEKSKPASSVVGAFGEPDRNNPTEWEPADLVFDAVTIPVKFVVDMFDT